METSATHDHRFEDHPRSAQSSQYPWQDTLPLLLNYFPDIVSGNAHQFGKPRDESVNEIEALEKGMVASQKLALEKFKRIANDTGRLFSPFLLLDPQNADAVGDYGVFATKSMGDFMDWGELRDHNLVNALNGTFKPSIPSPPQYSPAGSLGSSKLHEQKFENKHLDRGSPRAKWNQVHKPVGAYHGKKSGPGAIFRFNPEVLRFRNYVPGGVYEALFEVVNTSDKKSFCQLGSSTSPSLTAYSLSSTSYVASGMAVKYVAVFRPESYRSFTDRIEIFAPDGSRSVLCVQARNELPLLKYPSKVDLGKCLPGTTMKAVITVKNNGGFGMFYVMRLSEFDAFSLSEYNLREDRLRSLSHYNHYIFGRYEIRPALFELEENETVDLLFSLPIPFGAPDNFSVDFVMVGHLGQVHHFTVKAQVSPTILEVLHQKPKMKVVDDEYFCHVDLSASHVMTFPPVFPDAFVDLKFLLHNSSDFDLVYYWRNVVPRITTKLDALKDANADDWTGIEQAIFPISEIKGKESPAIYGHIRRVIKSGETLRFSTTLHLQKAGKQRACVQMVVTNIIPKPGKGYTKKIQLNRLTTIPFAVDITATCVEVDMTVPQEVMVEEMVMCGRQTEVMLPILNRGPKAIAVVAEDFMHDLPVSEQDFKLKFPPRPTIVFGNTNAHIRLSLTAKCHGQERVARFACREVETGVGFIVSARFVVQVPQLKFDPYVQVGGIPVGEVGTTTFKLSNSSCLSAPWRIFPILLKTERCVTFKPSEGTLRAGKSIMIKVTVRSEEPVELMAKCLLEVDHVRTRPLWIMASIQHPSLTVSPLHVTFDNGYLGFDFTTEFTVTNPVLFPITFSWGHVKDCQHIRVEHRAPVTIQKLEGKTVTLKFTAIAMGHFTGGQLPFLLNGKCFATAVISGYVHGPSIKVFLQEGNSFVSLSPSTLEVIPYPHMMELCKEVEWSFSLENDSPVPALFTALVEQFPKNWQPPEFVSEQMRVAELYHELNLPPKFRPLSISLSTTSGSIRQKERVTITLRITGVMWGKFHDHLCLKFDHGQNYRVPISFHIMSSPIRFLHNVAGSTNAPLLRFKAHTVGSPPEYRQLTVQNILPYDLEVDWVTCVESDEKDNHFGVEIDIQKLPYLLNTEMLSVGVPSLCGVPCDKVFSVYPKRLFVPALSTAEVTVKFLPPGATSDIPEFDGLLVGQARLKDRVAKGVGEPWMNGSYAPVVKMRLRAELLAFGLVVSSPIEPSLTLAAPDVISRCEIDEPFWLSPLCLANRTSAVMLFGLSAPFPFTVQSVLCKDPSGTTSLEIDTEDDAYCLSPQHVADINISFKMSTSQFATVLQKHVARNGYQNLEIRSDLGIWNTFVEEPQFVPLRATIILPFVKVSRTEIDFSISRIQQPYEQVFYLSNGTKSVCPWKLHFAGNASMFVLSETEGVLPASADMRDVTCAITVEYAPMSLGDHEAVVICSGLLGAEMARIHLRGSAVLDFGKSHVPLL